ncbi:hypothetical protein H5710_000834 [Staphylococcus pseudintermedius]|nr:hypothetical protein [Staphylococcus pseudintermedius]EHD5263701.1 hypothetical protein [Staphylococcus pseudintermedius]EII2717869.1 hypothetical protein [Staphylococcus pseudintermedius]EJA1920704.1 hypothetical protein [Staphylococcus pseudintermedius]EJY6953792.1 hypothetical protein [Staphylococcus pseudintermedius]
MKEIIKKIADIMNYEVWYKKLILLIVLSGLLIVGVLLVDVLINVIRILFNIELFVVLSPVFALLIMFACQIKYPKDKTRNYSEYAKNRM